MGMAPVSHVLFNKFMTFNPKNPEWVNRDRFVLSYVFPILPKVFIYPHVRLCGELCVCAMEATLSPRRIDGDALRQ